MGRSTTGPDPTQCWKSRFNHSSVAGNAWRTHAVMGVVYVKEDGSVEDIAVGWDKFAIEIHGSGSGEGLYSAGEARGSGTGTGDFRRNGFVGATKAYGIAT